MATITPTYPGSGNDCYSVLNAAFASAVDGDVVDVTAWSGEVIMTQFISIPNFVSFKGPGLSNLTIKRSEASSDANLTSWDYMFRWSPSTAAKGMKKSNVVVSGITFKSRIPSANNGADGFSIAPDKGCVFLYVVGFRVTECRFENFGNGGVEVRHRDYFAQGLIDNNQFYHNAKGSLGLGLGYGITVYGESNYWVANPNFGSPNFIFIEENTFDYHRHSVASAGCALYVLRYNTIRFNIIAPPYSHAVDTHESRGVGNGVNTFGTRAVEIYQNSIINSTRIDGVTPMANGCPDNQLEERAIGITAGDALVYNNTISGFRFAIGIISSEASSSGDPYPYIQQPGWLSGLRNSGSTLSDSFNSNGDLWYWSNNFTTFTLTGGGTCQMFYNYDASGGNTGTYFTLNRDYRNAVKPGYTPYLYPHPDNV